MCNTFLYIILIWLELNLINIILISNFCLNYLKFKYIVLYVIILKMYYIYYLIIKVYFK